ncbi:uncharacterized protein BDV14DRAFT_202789 [Aspergillus stella-maris]|uniref:uncharacterized protein n=1 Tax=Aspergillus stella-maris TaxID=1810926 RepID=UPI003CCDB722
MAVHQDMLGVEGHEDFFDPEDHHDTALDHDDDDDEYQHVPESEDESEFEHPPRRQSNRPPRRQYAQGTVPIAPRTTNPRMYGHGGATQDEEAWYDPSRWRVSRSKKKKNIFILPIPTPGELKTLLAKFTRPDSVRKGWGYSRNAGDAIEELWSTRYGWDFTTTRIEMDYGLLIRNLGLMRSHQQVNGRNCDRCFANGRSNPCDHDFQNACTPCVKNGIRCTYTDRRTLHTRELTGTANAGADLNTIPNSETWFRSDQPPVPETPWIPPMTIRDTKARPEPAAWRQEDARYDAHKQQYGVDPHVNPVLYENQGNNPQFIVNGVPHVNPAVHEYRARPSGRRLVTGPDGEEYRPARRARMRRLDLGTPAQDGMHPGMQNAAPGGAYGGQNFYPQQGYGQGQQYGGMPQQGAGQGMGGRGQPFNNGAGGRNPNPAMLTPEQAYINALYHNYHRLRYEVDTLHGQNQWFMDAFTYLQEILPKFVPEDRFPTLGRTLQRPSPFRGTQPPGIPLSVDTAAAQQAGQYGRQDTPQTAPPTMRRNPMNQPRRAGPARNRRPMAPPGSYPSCAQQASLPRDIKAPLQFGHPASAPPQQTSFVAPVHTPQQTPYPGSAHTPQQPSFPASIQPTQQGPFQPQQQFTAPQSNLAPPSRGPSRPTSTGFDKTLLDVLADPNFPMPQDFDLQEFFANGNMTPEQAQQLQNARRTPSDTINPVNLMAQQPQAQAQGPSQVRPRRSTIGDQFPTATAGLKRRFESTDSADQQAEPQIKRPRQDSGASSFNPGPTPQMQSPFQDLSAMNPGSGSVFAMPPNRRNAAVPGSQQSTMDPAAFDQFMAQSQIYTTAEWTTKHADAMTQHMAAGYESMNVNMNMNVDHTQQQETEQEQNHSESTDTSSSAEPETSTGNSTGSDPSADDDADADGETDVGAEDTQGESESDHDSLFNSNGENSSEGSNSQVGASRQATGSSGSSESIVAFHYAGAPPVGPSGGGDPGLESIPEEYGGASQ